MAIAKGLSTARAAAECGLSSRTVSRRLRNPKFLREVDRVRGLLVEKASARLSASMVAATECLRRLLKSNNENMQLGAARAILEFALRAREMCDLSRRLSALEQGQTQLPEENHEHEYPSQDQVA